MSQLEKTGKDIIYPRLLSDYKWRASFCNGFFFMRISIHNFNNLLTRWLLEEQNFTIILSEELQVISNPFLCIVKDPTLFDSIDFYWFFLLWLHSLFPHLFIIPVKAHDVVLTLKQRRVLTGIWFLPSISLVPN